MSKRSGYMKAVVAVAAIMPCAIVQAQDSPNIIGPQEPTITWNTPAPITYGTPLSSTQLNARASVAGTYTYTPPAGTVLTAGAHALDVDFTPTNLTSYMPAEDEVILTVNKATPSASLTSSNSSSLVGQAVVFTCSLSSTAGVPTGTVTFWEDGTGESTPTLSGGTATWSTSALAAGSHDIGCSYSGDSNFNSVPHVDITQTVKANTVTEIRSSPNPSAYGNTVTLTALIDTGSVAPTGSIAFTNNGSSVGSGAISAVSATNLLPYSNQFGSWAGGGYCGSLANMTANTTDVMAPNGTQTATRFVMPSSFTCGSGVSWGAVGSIQGGLTAGQIYTISIWMRGKNGGETILMGISDGNGTGTITLTNVWKRYTWTSPPYVSGGENSRGFEFLSYDPNATYYVWGAQTEAASTVGPYIQTGSSQSSGYGGRATLTTNTLPVGSDTIVASYNGDSKDVSSTASLGQTINPLIATGTLSSSESPSFATQSVTFICALSGSAGTPTGTVGWWLDGVSQGQSSVTNGSAQWSTSSLTVGSHDIGCTYNGDAIYANLSTHFDITQVVEPKPPSPSIASISPVSGPIGTLVTISGSNFGDTQMASSVTFNGITAPVSSWSASSIIAIVPTGATTGNVVVTVDGFSSNGLTFTVQQPVSATVYSYGVGYQANGNVQGYHDSSNGVPLMGTWSFSYDSLNRLAGAQANQPGNSFTNYCWGYDAFGNRESQEMAVSAFQSGSGGESPCLPENPPRITYNTNNQINGGPVIASYDAAGDVTYDGTNHYLYNADGQICAVQSVYNSMTVMTGYIYDADGNRVAKGAILTMSCDPSVNGFTTQTNYVRDQAGHQLSEFAPGQNGTMAWQHTNVYANGELISTEDTSEAHFYLNDWLGTRRVQTDYEGVVEQTCSSLPYGDGETCSPAPTEHLFTGKEHDSESGNDYFGARYYGSSMGRFLSPDYDESGDLPDPTPYADSENPQSLNLYGYVLDNPLKSTDADGHMHQECAPGTTVYDRNSQSYVVSPGTCQYVPDWWNIWAEIADWGRRQRAETNAFLAAHPETSDPNNLRIGMIPLGMPEGLGAGSILKILEEDGGAIHAVIQTSRGPIEVMANMTKEGDKLVLKGVHVGEGEKLSIGEIKQAARELGRHEGASEVEVQGGIRTGGANPGHTPQPFTVRVN